LEVVGPDGAAVGLVVRPSGGWGLIFSSGTGDWTDLVAGLALLLANLFSHWVLFRGGSTVHVSASGRRRVKIRLRSRTVAAACLREIAEAVRDNGLLALDRPPICSCAGGRGTDLGRRPTR
jgi:hypothetical protein